MLFNQLDLSVQLLRAIDDQGYREATPIQQRAIPLILEGRDLLAGAQTGTGKTAAFTLPLLHRLQKSHQAGQRKRIRALILTPTRELAAQVGESVRAYGRHLPIRAATIYGGVGFNPQIAQLRRGVDIVIATPGRLLDHVRQRTVDLSAIETLVLDEADRMLDMGFIRDIRRVMDQLPNKRQNLLFSATFSKEIRRLAADLLNAPQEIQAAARNMPADGISQVIWPVDSSRKRELLSHRIGAENWRQVLVFTRTKHGADRLSKQLSQDGLESAAIHGNKSQGARTRALADFKAGKVRVLVATDVAARGLDIDRLPHVVNYDLPHVPQDYVHRVGRTARAGQQGHAVSLVCVEEMKQLAAIERLLTREIRREVVAGYEPSQKAGARPFNKRCAQSPADLKSRRQDKNSRVGGNARPGKRKRTNYSKSRGNAPASRKVSASV
jgi:ATP-dependent RNA helicase RhlE